MAETPAEQRLERRGLEGTDDLSAVLGEMDDEDAEDARLRKELDERKRRRDEERSLALRRHAARGLEGHGLQLAEAVVGLDSLFE